MCLLFVEVVVQSDLLYFAAVVAVSSLSFVIFVLSVLVLREKK